MADHVCTPMAALPPEGQLVAVEEMYLLPGGCAANVAADVARQGIGVAVAGCVGDDVWGRFLRAELKARGAGCAGLRVAAGQQTSQTMILLCRGEDRRFVHTFGANRALRAAVFDRDLLAAARVFYLGGYLVMPGMLPGETADLFRFCREQGVTTVLDVVVPAGFRYGGELEPVLPYTDLFLPNDDEGKLLTGESDPVRQIRSLVARGASTVAVTLGGEGIVFTENGGLQRATAHQVEVVDQSGAGDAFAAGVIAGLVHGLDLRGCLAYGSALGAGCVRAIGCLEGVFTAPEAERFMADHPLDFTPTEAQPR